MNVHSVAVGPFMTNAYLLEDPDSSTGILVDPGDGLEDLEAMVRAAGVRVKVIVATHAHVDHIGAAAAARESFGAAFWMHRGDDHWRRRVAEQARLFGLPDIEVPEVDRYIEDGETLSVGGSEVSVRCTPGHSPGSISLVAPGHVIAGDTLFAGSVGRTDLPGGSWPVLRESIRAKLLSLPDETKVWPGHGPETTIGEERRSNPFLQDGGGSAFM